MGSASLFQDVSEKLSPSVRLMLMVARRLLLSTTVSFVVFSLVSGMAVAGVSGEMQALAASQQSGAVVGWGRSTEGQTIAPSGLSGVVAIAAGAYHSLALKDDGSVVARGRNNHDQSTVPSALSGVVAITAGTDHSLALKDDGTVVAWGRDDYGQGSVPSGLSGVVAIAAGAYHDLALKEDGAVVAWGHNNQGQSTVPSTLSGVVAIAAGGSHTLALQSDGAVVAWGYNGYGESSVPSGLSGVKAIGAGAYHSLALKDDGSVVAWGRNDDDQSTVPSTLIGETVTAITGGFYHTLALVLDNTAPVASDDPYTTNEDSTLNIAAPGVLINDDDANGDILTATLQSNVSYGTLTLNSDGSFSYTPNADYHGTDTFTYIASDGDLVSNIATVTITIASVNDAPDVSAGGPYAGDEGSAISLDGASASDVDGDPLSYSWSIDSPICTFSDPNVLNPTLTCDDNGAFTATLAVDDGTTWISSNAEVTVANVAPTATFSAPASVNEGEEISLALTDPVEPSTADAAALEYAFDCGNGYGAFSTANTASCPTTDNGTRTVRATIRDKDGGATEYTASVTINNVAPTADFAVSPLTLDEGQSTIATFSNPYDPGSADTTAGFTYSYDCTDDGIFEAADVTATSYTCHYADNGTFTLRGRIADKDGGATEYTVSVTVNNVAPTVGPITAPLDPVLINTEISVSAVFTDPGVLDTHTALWDWDDGSTSSGTVSEVDGSGSVTGSHTYTAAGVYTIQLTVTDKDGGIGTSVYEYVVVYDPDGGFATGGGWIDSPAGACQLEAVCAATAEGKANFGFVSKYKKGATVPTGNTEFNFKAGNLNFHSDAYEWLVITGGNYAKFKGSGTVNGEPAPNGTLYHFQIWAGDGTGSSGEDTFRIRIWYEEDDTEINVYDNAMDQPIGGGKIQVHDGK